jgi:zinc transporter ZupT
LIALLLLFFSFHYSVKPFPIFMDFYAGFSAGVRVESLLMLASICSVCALSETSSLDESLCVQLLLGFPCVMLPLAHENKV